MGATVVLSASTLAVEPGKDVFLEVRVKNAGTVVDQFTVEVLGEAVAWSTVEPPKLSLFPDAEGVVRVSFHPPRLSEIASSQVSFGVRVQSQEDPMGSVVEEGTIAVGAFLELAAELVPRTSRGRRSATHEIAVDNRGNARSAVALSASDADGLLRFSFRPPSLSSEPGTATFARVRVSPKERFFTGPPKTRAFRVLAQPDQGAPIAMDGGMLQEALIPGWLVPALLGLAALIVALVVLWFLLLKPAVVSTAKDAVAAPLAKQAAAIAALQKAAAGGGGGGGRPGSTPTPSPSSATTTTTTTNTDGRLSAGATASAGVANNSTLEVTDLVFANPNPDTGTVKLQRDNGSGGLTDLLVLKLDNFRDLDYHFVTPIVFTKGQKIVISCSTGAPPTSSCGGVSVYYTGFVKAQG